MDGVARIWHFDEVEKNWQCHNLNVYLDAPTSDHSARSRLKVTMITFDCSGSHIMTASSDGILRGWDSKTRLMTSKFEYHTDQVHLLVAHPKADGIIISGSWDGKVAIWDLKRGTRVKGIKMS